MALWLSALASARCKLFTSIAIIYLSSAGDSSLAAYGSSKTALKLVDHPINQSSKKCTVHNPRRYLANSSLASETKTKRTATAKLRLAPLQQASIFW